MAEHTQTGSPDSELGQVLDDADVFIGVSSAGLLGEQDVARMAAGAIVFALANPDPEIDPEIARRHVAVVATGRRDQPYQINNVLAFRGIFRGLLDGGAADLTVAAQCAAAHAIADAVSKDELDAEHIVPGRLRQGPGTRGSRAVMNA